MKRHELKLLTEYFYDVERGIKTFELRRDDRDFKVGDTLILKEYCQSGIFREAHYTGREIVKTIVYILHGGKYGLKEGFVILGIQ